MMDRLKPVTLMEIAKAAMTSSAISGVRERGRATVCPFSSVMITEDWRAVPVYIVLFILYLLTWYPFYKVYERQCVEEEANAA